MILPAQIDVAKDLLNTNDATIIGVLLGVIVMLIAVIGMLWKKLGEKEDQIVAENKENLKMIYAVTGTLDSFGKDVADIERITSDTNQKTISLLEIIKERLKINHGSN